MNGDASHGRRPSPTDLLMLLGSFAVVTWTVIPH